VSPRNLAFVDQPLIQTAGQTACEEIRDQHAYRTDRVDVILLHANQLLEIDSGPLDGRVLVEDVDAPIKDRRLFRESARRQRSPLEAGQGAIRDLLDRGRFDVRHDDEIDVVDHIPCAVKGARLVEREAIDVLCRADHPLAGRVIGYK
jgi:hypothetical protein